MSVAIPHYPSARPVELGDRTQLQRLISNLLANAVKYTPPGGRVTLAVGPQPDGRTALSVDDTGPGIAAEHLPRIFERFYRVQDGGAGIAFVPLNHAVRAHEIRAVRVWVLAQGDLGEPLPHGQPALSYANRAMPASPGHRGRLLASRDIEPRNLGPRP